MGNEITKMGNERTISFALQLRRKINNKWKWIRPYVKRPKVDITAGMEQVWEAAKIFTKEKNYTKEDDFPGELLLYIVIETEQNYNYFLEKTGTIPESLYLNDPDAGVFRSVIYIQPFVYSCTNNETNENDSWFVWLRFEKGDSVLRLEKVKIDELETTGKDLYLIAAKIAANLFTVSGKLELVSNGKRFAKGKKKIDEKFWHKFDEKIDFQEGAGIRVVQKDRSLIF